MFVIAVTFEIHEDQSQVFLQAVTAQAHNSLSKEPDCLVFDVCVDPDRPNRVFLYEVYSDEAAFEHHIKTDHFREFDGTVSSMVLSKTIERWNRLPARAS
ncbi:putative quinol monooxygenase [Pelagibius sp. Alg239-R121]|uniref:putative quinol monooxygenase n=1 Tax=Pelagibius sp. Alg239-R121 TaxID=2993448 RepID=UPI0024A66F4A|nr:putative quinol monooxygenase [Pelagibius sp. Alg239-R121]